MDGPETTTSPLKENEFLVGVNGRLLKVWIGADGSLTVDGEPVEARYLDQGDDVSVLVVDGSAYRMVIDSFDRTGGEFRLSVNGRTAEGSIDDRRSLLKKMMKRGSEDEKGSHPVKAPMPGLVLRVLVQPGQIVERGSGLIVLEAMKMENELKADRRCVVESVAVGERVAVEKGQVLLIVSDDTRIQVK